MSWLAPRTRLWMMLPSHMVANGPFAHVPRASGVWLLLTFFAFISARADWPQFRGINHDGVSTDRIVTNWTSSVTNPVWRVPVSNAICSVVISGGKLYSQAIRRVAGLPKETCVALSATHGNGAPIASNRAAAIELLSETNLVESLAQWIKLTNGLALTNGRVRIDSVDSTAPRRYFILREPN